MTKSFGLPLDLFNTITHYSCPAGTVQPLLKDYSHGQPALSNTHSSCDHNKFTQAKAIPEVHIVAI